MGSQSLSPHHSSTFRGLFDGAICSKIQAAVLSLTIVSRRLYFGWLLDLRTRKETKESMR